MNKSINVEFEGDISNGDIERIGQKVAALMRAELPSLPNPVRITTAILRPKLAVVPAAEAPATLAYKSQLPALPPPSTPDDIIQPS